MENGERKPELSESIVYVNGYENLVGQLAKGMVVKEKVLFPKEGDNFDQEDIYSWINAVKLRESAPKIEATLKEDKGEKIIYLKTEKLEPVQNFDEEADKDRLLYSMALTEAKMKVIKGVAEETYPAVAFQIADYQKEMEKVRKEIFEVRDWKVKMKEVFDKLNRNKVLKGATAIVILGLLIAGCTSGPVVNPETTDTSAVPTEVMPTEMPTPTEIPMSARPDFESMSDDELLQTFEEYRALFTEQIDCKPGAVGLPEAKEQVKIIEDNIGNTYWKSELLGVYEAPLTGKDGLQAGYVNCLYFAASNPGEVFTIAGGGELWGEDIMMQVDNQAFGISAPTSVEGLVRTDDLMAKLSVGEEYLFAPEYNTRTEDHLNSRDVQIRAARYRVENGGYASALMYFIEEIDIQNWIQNNVESSYPYTNTSQLIQNTEKPVYSWRLAPYTGE
ncbi:MAG TPA: hypothetical protein PLI45_04645 [Candidatus Woesebacteria bacterium]|nr:hypothetical protein [Candidatus Woesebacteria bacterium]